MRSAFCRLALTGAVVVACVLGFSTPAMAGVNPQYPLCGDPLDNPDCATTHVFSVYNQQQIAVEHSLAATGPWVWMAQTKPSTIIGFPVANPAIGGTSTGLDPQISTIGSDPAGALYNYLGGVAYDPVGSEIFIADTNNARVVVFQRGQFDNSGNLGTGSYPVDYTRPGQFPAPVTQGPAVPGSGNNRLNSPRGLAFDAARQRLYVIDYGNTRIQVFDSTPGTPGSSAPTLAYRSTMTSPGWDGSHEPTGVAVDPATGNVYVAAQGRNLIYAFDSSGAALPDVGAAASPNNPSEAYVSLAFDEADNILYAATVNDVLAFDATSGNYAGHFGDTEFIHTSGPSINSIDVDPVAHSLYVLNDVFGDVAANPPATAYTIDSPPTCDTSTPISLNAGANGGISNNFNCTDADGLNDRVFTIVQQPHLGSAVVQGAGSQISYHAGQFGGIDQIKFRVSSINGRSAVYTQQIQISGTGGGSSIIQPIGGRDTTGFLLTGVTASEGPYGLGKYQWAVNRQASSSKLVGYKQADSDPDQQAEFSCLPAGQAGQLSTAITGVGYIPNINRLVVADYTNNRIFSYERRDDSLGGPPVDCSTGEVITSLDAGDLAFGSPTGLSNDPQDHVYISGTFDSGSGPTKGVVAFNPTDPNRTLVHWDYDYGALDPGAIAVSDLDVGRVFLALSDGTIKASNVSLIDPAHDPHGNVIPPMSSGTPGNFISLAADDNTDRLWAMKANELDVFSMSTGTLLGTVTGIDWGGENQTVSAVLNTGAVSVSSSSITPLMEFSAYPNPICTPGQPLSVELGKTITFTPSCTDTDNSALKQFRLTNTQSLGAAETTANYGAIKYTAGAATGQDDIAYRVQTQDGLSVVKHQLINVMAAEQPVVRKSTNLQLDSGDVYVKVPGSNQFVKLTEDMLVPIGTIIDATDGKAHITLANADGTTYDGIFWDGIFQVLQGSGANPIATMKLRDDLVGQASIAAAIVSGDPYKAFISRRRGKKKNGIWGDAKGKFRTSGSGGSAGVRGTRWYVGDFTYGALFKVARGKVLVDPKRGKNFFLTAGKQRFIFDKR